MKPQIKTLCSYYGGSTLYHLMTKDSDLDERGVFMHTDVSYILGTKRFDEDRVQNADTDKVLKELGHFGSLVRKSNSEAMEVLFANESEFSFLSEDFNLIRRYGHNFVDSKNLFNCLRGYMKGELRLACGERKGAIGGKRYELVKQYGFIPKKFVQLLRLAQVGITYFTENKYVVDTREFGHGFHQLLMSIKCSPAQHTIEDLKEHVRIAEADLVTAFENRAVNNEFNDTLFNELLTAIYYPVITKAYNNLPLWRTTD